MERQQQRIGAGVQGVEEPGDSGPNWDMLVAPYSSCVSYVRDLSPLNFGDQVRLPRTLSSVPCDTAQTATVVHL